MLVKEKCCWIAKQYNKGWRLGFAVGNRKTEYLNVWFGSEAEINRVVGVGPLALVSIEMAKVRKAKEALL